MDLQVLGIVFIFLIGSVFGSFLLTAAERVRKGVTLWGRSACPECQHDIAPRHLVPLVSWLWMHGRCAHCSKPISFRYPLAELVGGVVASAVFLSFLVDWPTDWARLVFELVFVFGLLFFAIFDARWRLVPIEVAGAAALLIFLGRVLVTGSLVDPLYGVLFSVGLIGIQVVLSRGKLVGSGDPWAAAFIGAGLGWPLVGVAFYLTYVVGGVFLIIFWAMGVVQRGSRVPLVTLLAAGAFASLLWGEGLLAWAGRALGWF
jgi:prepilin signal peptidase PulO-like enzyme (type II secretory pathway)